MFITLTIDTSQKRKLRLHKKKFNPASGWRKAMNVRKRTLSHRIANWKRGLRTKQYNLQDQAAMF